MPTETLFTVRFVLKTIVAGISDISSSSSYASRLFAISHRVYTSPTISESIQGCPYTGSLTTPIAPMSFVLGFLLVEVKDEWFGYLDDLVKP